MKAPTTANELCQFIHCCIWMDNCLSDYHKIVRPSDEILEKAYAKTRKGKKTALKNIVLRILYWGTEHVAALACLQDDRRTTVNLAFPKQHQVVCTFTDAYEALWALGVTQAVDEDTKEPIEQKQHGPLAFLGCKLTGAQRNWTTYEKNA